MPLVWKFDPENSLVVAVAKGDVTRLDMDGYFDAIVEHKVLSYGKVFDVHDGETSMTADDVLPIAIRMRSLHDLGQMGPLAIVLPSGRGKRLLASLGLLAVADRPMMVFDKPVLAYRWIAKQKLPHRRQRMSEEGARTLAAHVRRLAATAGAEAADMNTLHGKATQHSIAQNQGEAVGSTDGKDTLLYRGRADIAHQGMPLNICVQRTEQSWEFSCCRADRLKLGTLLTLSSEEITRCLAQGEDPLERTLQRIKDLVRAGSLAIPDIPMGTY